MNSFVDFFQNFTETLVTWVVPSFFKIALILACAVFAKSLVNVSCDNFIEKSRFIKRGKTLKQIISSTGNIIIITITIMMILNELGLDIRPIIASAGIIGVAFSLGAQHLMKDIISGFFILLEGQFGVGDVVKVGDLTGTIEKMNLRTTTLKDSNGNTHIFPNGEIKQVSVLKC